jgi:hypothetical protein
MAVEHKFKNKTWKINDEEFSTENAILSKVPYNPKILILGTFNPTQDGNNTCFFYGRNYFWPAMFNLFVYKKYKSLDRSDSKKAPKIQTEKILEFCKNHQIVFADLISEILHHGNNCHQWEKSTGRGRPTIKLKYNNSFYNLIQDTDKAKNGVNIKGLNSLETEKQINWNTQRIIQYIIQNEEINTVYITCNPSGYFKLKWKEIKEFNYNRSLNFRRIFTPSGQGSRKDIKKMNYILKHWLGKYNFNNNYEGLDLDWIKEKLTNEEINSF